MLTMKVEGMAGSDVREILTEMCILASRLGCIIAADLNTVHCMVKPGADPRDAYEKWSVELRSDRQHPMFCAHSIEIPPPYTSRETVA